MIQTYDLFGEIIKPITKDMIPGIKPDTYFVSSYGNVYKKEPDRYGRMVVGYKMTPIGTSGKYAKVSFRFPDGTRATYTTCKLVALAFNPIPNKTINDIHDMGITFLDNDRSNLHATNLQWISRDDQLEYIRSFRDMDGEKCPNAVFTDDEVRLICKMIQHGFQFTPILNYIGKPVTNSNISQLSKIKRGITWKHISKDYNFPKR